MAYLFDRCDGANIKTSRELDRNYLHPVTDTQRLTREYIDRIYGEQSLGMGNGDIHPTAQVGER